MKKKTFLTVICTFIAALACLTFVSCGNSGKLEYSYNEAVQGTKLEMDNYNGMDLSGLQMYRFTSCTFDTYNDGTYVLKIGFGFSINNVSGSMGGGTTTYFGTYTVEADNDGEDNTEFTYALSVPTRIIQTRDITYMGSSFIDTDDTSTYSEEYEGKSADEVIKSLLTNGKYYNQVMVDREYCSITDKTQANA